VRHHRPDDAAIRRALAECMTLADIDDAMGWSPGTARRRRWSDPERGGLPPSDAELGGVPLWFRATIEEWRAERRQPRAAEPVPEPEEPEDETEEAAEEEPEEPEEEEEDEVEETEEPPPEPEDVEPDEDETEPVQVASGFELEPSQQVLAHVHRAWRPATVLGRDRRTVMVGYNINGTPLGARQQRVSVDRIRLLPT
jgi:hypothetical protein